MRWFDDILDIDQVATEASLHTRRDAILTSLPPEYTAGLPQFNDSATQQLADLNSLNQQWNRLAEVSCQ